MPVLCHGAVEVILQACEEELNSIDMVVNIKKSSCIVFKVYWLET